MQWVGEAEGRTDEQTIRSQLHTLTTMVETKRQDTGVAGQTKKKHNTEQAKVDPTKNDHNSQTVAQLNTNFQPTKTLHNRRYAMRSHLYTLTTMKGGNDRQETRGDRQTRKYDTDQTQIDPTTNKFTLTIHGPLHNFTQTFSTEKHKMTPEITRSLESSYTRIRVAHPRWSACFALSDTPSKILAMSFTFVDFFVV